ncbi:ligand-binding protein, receptor family, partial [Ancylostoma caninum]
LQLVSSQQTPSGVSPSDGSFTRTKRTIRIGGLFVDDNSTYFPFVGYTGSIGALYLAIDRIREDHLLDGFDFNITVRYDNCVEKDAVGLATELIRDFQVDVIIGPTCNVPALAVGVMAAYYNLPHYIWGFTTANELANIARFPTVIILTPNYLTLSLALLSVMDHFEWNSFAFIYSASEDEQKCPIFLTDIQKAVFNDSDHTLSNTVALRNVSTSEIIDALQQTSSRARIIVVCLTDPAHKRLFMLTAADKNLLNDEYVYIFADLLALGYTIDSSGNHTAFVWEDQSETPDGRDNDAHEAFKRTFMLTDVSGLL